MTIEYIMVISRCAMKDCNLQSVPSKIMLNVMKSPTYFRIMHIFHKMYIMSLNDVDFFFVHKKHKLQK